MLSPTEQRIVAVYRAALLHGSEPYIRTQAEAVPRYRSYYIGTHRSGAADALPAERTIVLADRYRRIDALLAPLVPARGRLHDLLQGSGGAAFASRTAYQATGWSPYLLRELRRLDPALLHAHTGINGAHVLPLVHRLKLPFVVTFHGYDATASDAELQRRRLQGRVYLRRRAALQREAQRAIAVSRFTADALLAGGWPAERVVVHYMGVDTQLFRPDPAATPLREREPIVFYAGRLIEKKGLEVLIDAMPAVQARVPGAQVVIAGTGERQPQLQRRAEAAGARVRFIGYVPPDEVRGWMARAQLYCMPSVRAANGDGEGLPTALVEAMACGVPVVATQHAGIPEAVTHGSTGLLAPERDAAALAAQLSALLCDGELRARMGAAARQRVLEDFDHRRQAARLATIYDEVCAERGGG